MLFVPDRWVCPLAVRSIPQNAHTISLAGNVLHPAGAIVRLVPAPVVSGAGGAGMVSRRVFGKTALASTPLAVWATGSRASAQTAAAPPLNSRFGGVEIGV